MYNFVTVFNNVLLDFGKLTTKPDSLKVHNRKRPCIFKSHCYDARNDTFASSALCNLVFHANEKIRDRKVVNIEM